MRCIFFLFTDKKTIWILCTWYAHANKSKILMHQHSAFANDEKKNVVFCAKFYAGIIWVWTVDVFLGLCFNQIYHLSIRYFFFGLSPSILLTVHIVDSLSIFIMNCIYWIQPMETINNFQHFFFFFSVILKHKGWSTKTTQAKIIPTFIGRNQVKFL